MARSRRTFFFLVDPACLRACMLLYLLLHLVSSAVSSRGEAFLFLNLVELQKTCDIFAREFYVRDDPGSRARVPICPYFVLRRLPLS